MALYARWSKITGWGFIAVLKAVGWVVALAVIGVGKVMAIEEAEYTVVLKEQGFEVREYQPYVVAETMVDGDFEDAGNQAFRLLFKYISGNNQSQQKVAMTAPVTQEPAGEKIDMTTPVGQQRRDGGWAVSFVMPSSYSLETLPEPIDPDVVLRQVPGRYMASVRYSGFWNETGYRRNLEKLTAWVKDQDLKVAGDPVWARYNAPFVPWFLRRNEILLPIEKPSNID